MKEDRALRDSARALFRDELKHVRREATPGAIGERIANRIGAKADAASDAAVDFAAGHGRMLAAVLAGVVAGASLWFAHKPLGRWLAGRDETGDGEEGEEDPK